MRKFFIKTPFDVISADSPVCHIDDNLSTYDKKYSDLKYGDIFMLPSIVYRRFSESEAQLIKNLQDLSAKTRKFPDSVNHIIANIDIDDFINLGRAYKEYRSILINYPDVVIKDTVLEKDKISTSNTKFYIKIDDKSNIFPHTISTYPCCSKRSVEYRSLPLYSVFCLDKYTCNLSAKSKKEAETLQKASRVLITLSTDIKNLRRDNSQFHPFDLDSRKDNNDLIELYSSQISMIISTYMRFVTGVTDISTLEGLVCHTTKQEDMDSCVSSNNCNNTNHDDEFEVAFFNACAEADMVIW